MLSRGDIVVLYKNHLEQRGNLRIVVYQVSNRVDELDNRLGANITRCGLCTKDDSACWDISKAIFLNTEVKVQNVERVHELALVLVEALNLHVKDGFWINLNALALEDPLGEVLLISSLDSAEFFKHGLIVGIGAQLLQLIQIGYPIIGTGKSSEQVRQTWVDHAQPTAWGNTVGLVVELLWP